MGELWFSPSTLEKVKVGLRTVVGEVYLIDGKYCLANEFVGYYPLPQGHPIPEDSLFLGIDTNGLDETCKHLGEATEEHAQNCTLEGLIDERLFVEKEN